MSKRVVASRIVASAAGLFLFMFSLGAAPRGQAEGRGEYLGEANVDGQADHDNISVTGSRGAFRAIQIRVAKAPIEFDRVVIHYANGNSEPIEIRSTIPAGGQTRVIDLPGERRIIQSVEFWYARARPGSRQPKVRVFGIR